MLKMTRTAAISLVMTMAATVSGQEPSPPDIATVEPDLVLPEIEIDAAPAPGKRVFWRPPGDPAEVPPLVLYLPVDWSPGKKFPVLCEYAGNGNFKNAIGDISTGRPEGSKLGYGLSGGKGCIWACLPFLNDAGDALAITWWGSPPTHRPDATVAHAKRAVPAVCAAFSGDPDRVILCGFSRGAIACNAIGLHDEEIAKRWRGFFCYSHYDGAREGWPFAGADRASALVRLRRLGNRPQFLCQEGVRSAGVGLDATRKYLAETGLTGDFTFVSTGFRNHNDAWLLRPSPARAAAREWLARVISQ
ncbi:MAG: hypothetical protein KDM91_09335 [Verrucomicrobiae bacterium]|nr:hypothetical protein [Verrucomicrobiae bacterium]MCP5540674.1 hypothetical protein [Akkermansiaceae bacterium]